MLTVSQLSCERDHRLLFDGLSFQVNAGEVVQVKGPNGAGKTTLLRILCGLYTDFTGDVDWQVETYPLYMGHKPGVKDLLTAEENLRCLCELHQEKVPQLSLANVLAEVGLLGYEDVECGSLSEGQRKRVNLARFYLLDSPVWLLDEPFSAIDVEGVAKIEALINRHVNSGGSIIFTSHQAINVDVEISVLDLGVAHNRGVQSL